MSPARLMSRSVSSSLLPRPVQQEVFCRWWQPLFPVMVGTLVSGSQPAAGSKLLLLFQALPRRWRLLFPAPTWPRWRYGGAGHFPTFAPASPIDLRSSLLPQNDAAHLTARCRTFTHFRIGMACMIVYHFFGAQRSLPDRWIDDIQEHRTSS